MRASGTAAVAVGGDVNAPITTHYTTTAPPIPVRWPVRVGSVPELASAFQPRTGVRDQIRTAREHGVAVVLVQPEPASRVRVLSGGGGVGKSQVAAWFAHEAADGGAAGPAADGGAAGPAADLVIWAGARSQEEIVSAYAQAAHRVQAPGFTGTDVFADARCLLEWLSVTERRWLIVLDDITDPAHLTRWWPPHRTATGWTLATTRLRDATLAGSGRVTVDIDVYRPAESCAYLTERLGIAGKSRLLDGTTAQLAATLGHLPLALSHAAAYLINEDETGSSYLTRFDSGLHRLHDLMPFDADDYGRPVAVALLLALDAAAAADPAGLARPALALAAVLDPHGHPESLWSTDAVLAYLTAHRDRAPLEPVTADQARKALRLLHRYGLLNHAAQSGPRGVRMHALTARAARELTDPFLAANAAADALLAAWPEDNRLPTATTEALRASVAVVRGIAGDTLWNPEYHPVLNKAGDSLLTEGLYEASASYWQTLTEQAERLLGPDHTDTLTAQMRLAVSLCRCGRTGEATVIGERAAAGWDRVSDPEHVPAITARLHLAVTYRNAGRTAEAITLLEQVVAAFGRTEGPTAWMTLTSRTDLAIAYRDAGRVHEAIAIEEQAVTDFEQQLGPADLETLKARSMLASLYLLAGRWDEAIRMQTEAAAGLSELLGRHHPTTLIARSYVAVSHMYTGQVAEAVTLSQEVATDTERALGPEHPETLTARGNLAAAYLNAGQAEAAVTLTERVSLDAKRLLGPRHPLTLTAGSLFARAYLQCGDPERAIAVGQQVADDVETLFGPDHPNLIQTRAVIAVAYLMTGRTADGVALAERTAADSERLLGADHPDTASLRLLLTTVRERTSR
ncbi:tetratricopeptide repeat protein [Actinoplanes sp. GCM10030250]|uniref:tetratricopeptide repeat protein n=1 Tax=Actinoplanes sp. GCM10030250 TaxID=3273376 RepID=UPI0036133C1C